MVMKTRVVLCLLYINLAYEVLIKNTKSQMKSILEI